MSLRGMWLVADMDGTLTMAPHRAGGWFPPLTESPCYRPVVEWLKQGGRLALLTTAGPRMVQQVWDAIPPNLRANHAVALGGYSGAMLCYGDATGDLVEDVAFRMEMRTCIPHDFVPRVLDICRNKLLKFLDDAAQDPKLIDLLSLKYHEPFRELAALTTTERQRVLSMEALTAQGRFISKPQLDTVLDVQRLFTDSEHVGQITMMGIPMTKFSEYWTQADVDGFATQGLFVKAQPNSVCIGVSSVSKKLAVEWLCRDKTYKFSLNNAVGIADTPDGPDRPLTECPPMPFVSVAPTNRAKCELYVGQEEIGSARWIETVLALPDPSVVVRDKRVMRQTVDAVAKLN
eukprot:PhM_4_TR2855/c0_g1_i1/m.92904